MDPSETLSQMLHVLDLVGVFANALLGGAIARAHRLDPVGFAVLAVLSGLGGGLLRDVLLQAGPPIALTDSWYLGTALVAAAIAYAIKFEGRLWDRVFPWIDALAVGTWAAVGAQKTLALGLGWLPAMLLGVITAVGGGAIRDIAVGKIPSVLGGNTLYATSALAASATAVLFYEAGHPAWGMASATAIGAALCLLARWRGWMLPEEIPWSAVPVRKIVRPRRSGRRRPPGRRGGRRG